jgi:hypothetical protein
VTKRTFTSMVLFIVALSIPLSAANAQTFSLFSTGVDATGTPLANGATDSHYEYDNTGDAFVLTNQDPGFYVQSPTAKWIWTSADGSATGSRHFLYRFTLTTQEVASGITLTGRYATDNTGSIDLNENPLSFNSSGFSTWTNFTITSNFRSGTNFLYFGVNNSSGPGGLIVDQLQYTVGPAASAPEPGTLALLALGGVGAFLRKRRGA